MRGSLVRRHHLRMQETHMRHGTLHLRKGSSQIVRFFRGLVPRAHNAGERFAGSVLNKVRVGLRLPKRWNEAGQAILPPRGGRPDGS